MDGAGNHNHDVIRCSGMFKNFKKFASDHHELGMLMISARLKHPYEIIKVIQHFNALDSDLLILRDPTSQSGTTVLQNLEQSISETIKLISQNDDFSAVAEKITEFYECAELFTSLMSISPKSIWGSLIFQIRSDLFRLRRDSNNLTIDVNQWQRFRNTGIRIPRVGGEH